MSRGVNVRGNTNTRNKGLWRASWSSFFPNFSNFYVICNAKFVQCNYLGGFSKRVIRRVIKNSIRNSRYVLKSLEEIWSRRHWYDSSWRTSEFYPRLCRL